MTEQARQPSDDPDKFVTMPWIQWLGVETVEAAAGRAVIRLDPRRPEHLNHNGTVNAPVLYGLAEVAGAGAVVAGMVELAALSYTVVRSAQIEYLGPARGVVTATGQVEPAVCEQARATVAGGGRIDVTVPVEITDPAGSVVTRCRIEVSVRPTRR